MLLARQDTARVHAAHLVRSFLHGIRQPVYLVRHPRIRSECPRLGLLIAVGGAANLEGAFFAPRLIGRIGLGPAIIAACLLVGVAAFVPALAHGSVMTCCQTLAVAKLGDIALPVAGVGEQTLCQAVAPAALFGRVNSAMRLMFRGVLPAGALSAGVVATVLGVRYTIGIGALGLLLSSLFLFFSPLRPLRTLPQR